jgi:hypothetical protein
MIELTVRFEKKGEAFRDLLDKHVKILDLGHPDGLSPLPVRVAVIEHGMASGQPSVALDFPPVSGHLAASRARRSRGSVTSSHRHSS